MTTPYFIAGLLYLALMLLMFFAATRPAYKQEVVTEVDHSTIEMEVYRTPVTHRFLSEPWLPVIDRAMRHYRYGPPRSEVYHLLKEVRAHAATYDTVGLSYEEVYFVTKHLEPAELETLYLGSIVDVRV